MDSFEPFTKTLKPDGVTTPHLGMPNDCKTDDPVSSYRKYYLTHKNHLLMYTRREIPGWIREAGLGTWKEAKF